MKDADSLGPAEHQAWVTFLAAAYSIQAALEEQMQRDAGIPYSWFGLLALLADSPGQSIRQVELARHQDFSESRLSYTITKLAKRGWVRRERDLTDRRAWLVSLTDLGQATLSELAPAHLREVRRLFFEPLTARQVDEVRRGLAKVLRAQPPSLQPPCL